MKFNILIISVFFFSAGNLFSQPSHADSGVDSVLYAKYSKSLDYLSSFMIDSAGLLLDTLIAELKGTDLEDSPFGLRVKSKKAESLDRDHKIDLALTASFEVTEKSLESEVWDVYANSSINLALIYERIGKADDCITNLRNAQRTIESHPELAYFYPFFYVRISSYHRIYDNRDSAIYYAKACLQTYKQYDDYAQGGDGHMLMTMLTYNEDPDASLMHAKTAAEIFRKLDNHTGFGYMVGSIAGMYMRNGDYKKALLYNDTTLSTAKRSIKEGFDLYHTLYNGYKFRGDLYGRLGQPDSSIFYTKKGYELQNKHIQDEHNSRVFELDAKYKDDKKLLKIKEQEEQLKSQNVQRRLMNIIFGLVILFTSGLVYYYFQLRKANRQTKLHAEEINKKNKELSVSLNKQIVLQGEVHHRVKNNLQVIISLLDLQKSELKDKESKDYIDSMSKRIYSMAAIHNLLYQKEDMEFISLHDYVENLCYHFSNFSIEHNKPDFTLNIDKINLNLETSMPIGIIITELLTNSLKYARIKGQKLNIFINIVKKGDGLLISYKDNGPGFEDSLEKNNSGGLGFYILESMTRQLQGNLIRKNDNGAAYEIFLKEKNKWQE